MQIVYKPVGITCGEVVDKFRKEYNCSRIAFAGRLDPMAQGHLLVVYDDEVDNIQKYHLLDKTYQFKFTVGYFATDSSDVLGLFNNDSYNDSIDINILKERILSFDEKTIQQKYHKFSSFVPAKLKIDNKRKPLWWWSIYKPSEIINIPSKSVNIYSIKIDKVEKIDFNNLRKEIIKKISAINENNEFRQKDILEQWNNYKNDINELIEFTCTIKVSSGFYVRQFVQDLSDHFNVKMMVTEIDRIKVFT